MTGIPWWQLGLSLLPIIGNNSSNQHTRIISSMYYQQEFFNRIDPKRTFVLDKF
jgi:hypothetical protein